MSRMSSEKIYDVLDRMLEEVKRLRSAPKEPEVRRFEKPDYDPDNWVQCQVCKAWSDVDPCDLCCREGYVALDIDGQPIEDDDGENVRLLKPWDGGVK